MDVVTISRVELRKLLDRAATDAAAIAVDRVRHELVARPSDYLFKEWVTTAEFAALLGRTDTESVRALRDQVDHRREGRGLLWRRASIDTYIEGLPK